MKYRIWARRTYREEHIVEANNEAQAVDRFLKGQSQVNARKIEEDYFGLLLDSEHYYHRQNGNLQKNKLNPKPRR